MTREPRGTLRYAADLADKAPPDANATDLVMAYTIIDASAADEGEHLKMHGNKIFNTDRPAEPVMLKDVEIIKIAYRSDG